MKFGIVPVKDLSRAKERLASILPQDVRTALAYAMLEDVLIAVKGSGLLDRRFIVTMDAKAMEIARGYGIEIIEETEQSGESASVDRASMICIRKGASSVLVIPGDAPLITSSDIDSVLEREANSPSTVMVPARDRLGTNAILRKPPDAFPSRFGHDSFRKHIDEAQSRNVSVETFENARIALDIDHPDDLSAFASRSSDTRAYKLLMSMDLLKKVAG